MDSEIKVLCDEMNTLVKQPFPQRQNYAQYYFALFSLGEKIIVLQKDESCFKEDICHRHDYLKKFSSTFEDQNVFIKHFPNEGYGLSSLKNILKYDAVLRISKDLMICAENAFSEPGFGKFVSKDVICMKMHNVTLALYLLFLKLTGKKTVKHYIEALPNPSSYNLCLYFNPEQFKLLNGTSVQEKIISEYRNICRQYAYFFNLFNDASTYSPSCFKSFCFEDYRWAVGTVMSRNNPIPLADNSGIDLSLVPLWDMMNHQFGEVTTDYDLENRTLIFYSQQDVKPGEQIFLHYGNRTNLELFLYSGFICKNNPYDAVDIKLGLNPKDALLDMKCQILARLNLSKSGTFKVFANGSLSESLLAFCRVFCAEKLDLILWVAAADVSFLCQTFHSTEISELVAEGCDQRAATFIKTRLQLICASMRSTAEEDTAHLESDQTGEKEKLIYRLRLSERAVLTSAIQLIK